MFDAFLVKEMNAERFQVVQLQIAGWVWFKIILCLNGVTGITRFFPPAILFQREWGWPFKLTNKYPFRQKPAYHGIKGRQAINQLLCLSPNQSKKSFVSIQMQTFPSSCLKNAKQ